MNTIRCPHCGVVNLRKFVTYPFCAGCGKRLPPLPPPPFWQRTVGPQVWAFLLCGCALFLLVAVAFVMPPAQENGQLDVVGYTPGYAKVGESVQVQLQVSQKSEGVPDEEVLNDLTLRIPLKTLEKMDVESVQPRPDREDVRETGRYYLYREFPNMWQVVLKVRPRKAGNLRLFVLLSAARQTSAGYRALLHVEPRNGKIPGISPTPSPH